MAQYSRDRLLRWLGFDYIASTSFTPLEISIESSLTFLSSSAGEYFVRTETVPVV